MTINERIKQLRKSNNFNQKQFAELLGLTQSGVSYLEQNGSNVSDTTIKTICVICNANETWLRSGEGAMLKTESESVDYSFSLDKFFEERHATDLEREIIKAYLDLDPEIRKKVIEHFKARLGRFGESTAPNVTVFRAARSDSDTPPGEVEISASDLERLKNATPVTSDDDI